MSSNARFRGIVAGIATALLATGAVAAQETDAQRPSWIIGGYYPIGIVVPLSDVWSVRGDLNANGWRQPLFDGTGWEAGLGVGLVRRLRSSADASPYAAVRYGLEIWQEDDAFPRWSHLGSLTLGGQLDLRGRLGVFGETGVLFRYFEQGPEATRVSGQAWYGLSRVGITVRWKVRAP